MRSVIAVSIGLIAFAAPLLAQPGKKLTFDEAKGLLDKAIARQR
jgi:hypothetical protein